MGTVMVPRAREAPIRAELQRGTEPLSVGEAEGVNLQTCACSSTQRQRTCSPLHGPAKGYMPLEEPWRREQAGKNGPLRLVL